MMSWPCRIKYSTLGGISATGGLALDSKPAMNNLSVDMLSMSWIIARRSRWVNAFVLGISSTNWPHPRVCGTWDQTNGSGKAVLVGCAVVVTYD